MNVTLEKIGDGSAKIIVNVEENDYKEKVDKELRNIGRTHNIPGFRKGHVPMTQLQRLFGKQVKSDTINHEVYNAVISYLRDNKIEVLGEPLPVEVKEINLNDADYTFEYEIGLAPEINFTLGKETKLPYYAIEVSKEMEDEQSKMLRDRFGAQLPGEEYEDRALVKGSIMELNEDGTIKTTEDAIQVVAGIVGPFLFKSKEEAAKFEGKRVGDKVVFNPYNSCDGNASELSSMLQISKERAPEVKGDFEMAISEIIVHRPAELNQEFFDEVFGKDKVHNEEEYIQSVRAMVASQLAPNSEALFTITTEKELVKEFGNFDLPDTFLKKWLVARNEELTAENIDEEYAKMVPSIKWQLIKERIAAQADFKVEKPDMLGYAKSIAARQLAQYGMYNLDDETVTGFAERILNDERQTQHIYEEVYNMKLFNAIKNLVDIDLKKVTLDEFKEIAKTAQE